ncbi:MAG: hypothetical protein GEU92_14350 [Alphaproteobacteria bacterium]|nr:hypothetical protein [Alphaproteobacteria bacterium]
MGKDPQRPQAQRPASQVRIDGEPDLASATLEEWLAYRRSLAALPQNDENVRIAIAVADAQIARLR